MNKPNETSYLLENIPKDLWTRAKTKCAQHDPPLAIKWLLLELLTHWVEHGPTERPSTSAGKRPRELQGKKHTVKMTTTAVQERTDDDVVDVGF